MTSISFFLSLSLPHQTIKNWPRLGLISGTNEPRNQLQIYEFPVQNSRFLEQNAVHHGHMYLDSCVYSCSLCSSSSLSVCDREKQELNEVEV